jgi:serine/alanine adding enzyme
MTAAAISRRPVINPVSGLYVMETTPDPRPWNSFVSGDRNSTFCHLYGWREIMSDVLGHESLYLVAMNDLGQWKGVLPLVRVRSVLGHYLISVPFLNDGGPIGNREARETLAAYALEEAKRSGAVLLELRSRLNIDGETTPANRKISVHLPLPGTVEDLWNITYRAKLRSQIRRPMKEGATAANGPAEIHSFYEVFTRNMRDLGTPVLPRKFFERIAGEFGSHVLFASVRTKSGEPAAAACCLIWRNEIEVTWASSIRSLNHLSPNMLLYSHLMEESIRRGLTLFNFGRCSAGGSTHRFKQQWGGHDVALPWPTWRRGEEAGVPSQESRVLRAASNAWRRLPLPVANKLGPGLARLLP